jgi:hypothetical protein
MIEEQIEFRNREVFTRHGGAYDRGSADAYYWRSVDPHYYTGASFQSTRIEEVDMSEEEIAAYMAGYNETTDRKDWG